MNAAKRVRRPVFGDALPGKHPAFLNQALRVSLLERQKLRYDRRQVYVGRLNIV